MGNEIDEDTVFVETSVLVDLAQNAGGSSCFPIFKKYRIEKVVSQYVREEYKRKKENRERIVEDYQRRIGTNEDGVDDLSLPKDDHLSDADLEYAADLLADLSEEDEMAVLKELDDRRSRFRKVHRLLFDGEIGVVTVFSADLDPSLLRMLEGPIGNRDDQRVIAEAADWADSEDTETVLSLDEHDIVENEDEINDVISRVRGFDCELAIYQAAEFASFVLS